MNVQEGYRVPHLLLHLSDLCAPGSWETLARSPELVKHQHWSLLGAPG